MAEIEAEAPGAYYETSAGKRIAPGGKHRRIAGSVILAAVLGAIIIAALSFVGGMQYGKHHPAASAARTAAAAGRFGGAGAGAGGFGGARRAGSIGTVSAISATSITVNDQRSGGSKTYTINSSTQITDNGATVTYSDIAVGDTVLVTAGSSASTTATRILVNPSFGDGFGGASAPGGSQSSTQAVTD